MFTWWANEIGSSSQNQLVNQVVCLWLPLSPWVSRNAYHHAAHQAILTSYCLNLWDVSQLWINSARTWTDFVTITFPNFRLHQKGFQSVVLPKHFPVKEQMHNVAEEALELLDHGAIRLSGATFAAARHPCSSTILVVQHKVIQERVLPNAGHVWPQADHITRMNEKFKKIA